MVAAVLLRRYRSLSFSSPSTVLLLPSGRPIFFWSSSRMLTRTSAASAQLKPTGGDFGHAPYRCMSLDGYCWTCDVAVTPFLCAKFWT